jgi:hypothetical protein
MNVRALKLPSVCRWLKRALRRDARAAAKETVARDRAKRHHRRKITTVFFEMP